MKQRKLGRTDLHVSELGLSLAQFGWMNDDASAFAVLDAYRAGGGNFYQSIGCCPSPHQRDLECHPSVEILGRWQQARAIPRGSLVLATRFDLRRPVRPGGLAFTNLIRECCETSLRRLRAKHLDLLICDWDEQLTPLDDVMDAFDMLIRAGLVRHAVAAGFPPWRIVDVAHRSSLRNRCRFEALQMEYSLVARSRFETEALELCREFRLGFLVLSPLAGGFLARRPTSIREIINLDRRWLDDHGGRRGEAVLTALSKVAEKRQASPAQIALAWVLRHPQVTSAFISTNSASDVAELVHAADIALTNDEVGSLANANIAQDYRLELRDA